MKKLRILPLLVLVAFFTFVFRLGEFVTDVRQLDASSFAATTADAPQAPEADRPMPVQLAAAQQENADDTTTGEQQTQPPQNNVPLGDNWSDPASIDLNMAGGSEEVLQELIARRKELDARERQLEQKEALLMATETQVNQKLEELKTLRTDLKELLDQQETEEEERIKSLVKIYEGMKPREAANIFNTLDMKIMLQVVSRMSERKSAPILASMEPDTARELTVLLARQKQLPKGANALQNNNDF